MSRTRILVVDDDSTFRNFMKDLLSGLGREIAAVISGEDAIHELEERYYDLAIVDINLPGWISGLDLLREIQGLCPRIKVIVCSAHGDHSTVEEAFRLGANEFIEKPVDDLDRLLGAVKRALNSFNLSDESHRAENDR